jgi:RHS repeat-associated protein
MAEDKRRVAVEQRDQADEYRRLAGEPPEDNAVESRFVYGPNGRLIGEYDARGNTVRETVRLGTTPVASLDAESRLHYLHTDHLGTPREATRPGGPVVWRWTSSPFGVAAPNADVDGDGQAFTLNLRFPGQYFDEETGTHYNYFRDYDSGVGRYVQSDPRGILLDFTDPQRVVATQMGISEVDGKMKLNHLYGYARQNPIGIIDPTGEFAQMFLIASMPGLVVAGGFYFYDVGLEICGNRYPNHNQVEHPDFAQHRQCVARVAGVVGLGMGLGADPRGAAASAVGEAIGGASDEECE